MVFAAAQPLPARLSTYPVDLFARAVIFREFFVEMCDARRLPVVHLFCHLFLRGLRVLSPAGFLGLPDLSCSIPAGGGGFFRVSRVFE